MPTLAEVAKRAGVSTATVSKVLSNTPYFTEETRAKVMHAVEELRYVPNLAGRALSTGKTNMIAVVFPYVYDAVFTDPHVQHILEGVEAECTQHGYSILLSTPKLTEAGPDQHYLQLIRSGYIDGIVALDNVPIGSVVEPALERDIPAVAIGHDGYGPFVRTDDQQGGYLLMQHLLELGHRHIGIIASPANLHFPAQERLAGMQAALEGFGITFDSLPQREGNFSMPDGGRLAVELLDEHPELTALICLNDRMALGAIQELRLRGVSVPEDVSIVGYDDIPLAALFAPSLTTINQHAPDLGRAAVQMVFSIMNGETPEPLVLPAELVARESSGPART